MNLKKHCKSHKENTVHVERKKIKIRCSPSIQGGPPHVRQRHSLCPFSNVLLVFLETTSINPHNSDDCAVTEGSFRPSRISARCSVSGERRGERQQSHAGRCWGGLCLCCFVGAPGEPARRGRAGHAQLSEGPLPSLPLEGRQQLCCQWRWARGGSWGCLLILCSCPSTLVNDACPSLLRSKSSHVRGNICSGGCRALQS